MAGKKDAQTGIILKRDLLVNLKRDLLVLFRGGVKKGPKSEKCQAKHRQIFWNRRPKQHQKNRP
jgi:hypothetical protein